MDMTLEYLNLLINSVFSKISEELNDKPVESIVKDRLIKSHIEDTKSLRFQKYYFATVNNEKEYHRKNFFHQFKGQYSLQGVDKEYLKRLEDNKIEILHLIKQDKLPELYQKYFYRQSIKHGDSGLKEKDFGSYSYFCKR